ncbi:zinc finger protein 708-like [Hetaerina americana]|uniref:zinc finger protein 708-like n=1 Tax=Hetaerina americana TaxID=62018 RepID=UPI003A7F1A35
MCDKIDFVVCRLCLNGVGQLINITDESNKSEFMLEKTIEDLINVKVVEDARYPWLVCSTCMEKLTEFRLFKHRCAECLFVFYNRIQKGSNPAEKYLIINREEEESDVLSHGNKDAERPGDKVVDSPSSKVWEFNCPVEAVDQSVGTATVGAKDTYSADMRVDWMAENNYNAVEIQFPDGIKKECGDDVIISDAIDNKAVDFQDEMITVKEEVETASECSATKEKDTDSSMRDGESYWSHNEYSGTLDHSEERELQLSFNEEVDIKEEYDVEIPPEERGLEDDMSQAQDGGERQDSAEKNDTENFLHMCQICDKVFTRNDILKVHMTRAHLVKVMKFRCDVCSECKSELDAHMELVHAVKKKHQCQQCSRNFQNQIELRNHMLTHTDERPYSCDICLKAFLKKTNLKRHISMHNFEYGLKCETCLKIFARKKEFTKHVMLRICESSYNCALCLKVFANKANLKRHMLTHAGEKPHKCGLCSKAFALKQTLKTHMSTHDGEKPNKCKVCSKGFHHKQQLEGHMCIHTGKKPHICGVCLKGFTLKQTLKSHMCIHTGENPYKCEECPKEFAKSANLKRHMLTHSGKRWHKCEICLKSFTLKQTLKSHMLIHAEDKPYKCPVCSKGFHQKQQLEGHMFIHTGEKPYKCEICSKAFNLRQNLTGHLRIHTRENPYQCELCPKVFLRKAHLKRHLLTHTDKRGTNE